MDAAPSAWEGSSEAWQGRPSREVASEAGSALLAPRSGSRRSCSDPSSKSDDLEQRLGATRPGHVKPKERREPASLMPPHETGRFETSRCVTCKAAGVGQAVARLGLARCWRSGGDAGLRVLPRYSRSKAGVDSFQSRRPDVLVTVTHPEPVIGTARSMVSVRADKIGARGWMSSPCELGQTEEGLFGNRTRRAVVPGAAEPEAHGSFQAKYLPR